MTVQVCRCYRLQDRHSLAGSAVNGHVRIRKVPQMPSTLEERETALREFFASGRTIRIEMSAPAAFSILAMLQLAMRHPQLQRSIALQTASVYCHCLIAEIAPDEGPLRDLCQAGFDPAQDA